MPFRGFPEVPGISGQSRSIQGNWVHADLSVANGQWDGVLKLHSFLCCGKVWFSEGVVFIFVTCLYYSAVLIPVRFESDILLVTSLSSLKLSLTHRSLGDFNNFNEQWLRYLSRHCPQMNATRPYWWQVNIGSGKGLVPSGNKPLPEPMLTQIYVAKWCH